MLRPALLISALLIFQAYAPAQDQANRNEVPVEVVATASEYISHSTTVSHPGHAYTDCHGSTSYLGNFRGFEDSNGSISGRMSGTADTDTYCSATYTPPSESMLTTYRRVNYTITKSDQALYLLSCTQEWGLTRKQRLLIAAISGSPESADKIAAGMKGSWSDCPAFSIGDRYALRIQNASDARLEDSTGGKPIKLEYLSSVPLISPTNQQVSTVQAQTELGDALSIGVVTLRLGMPKDAALSELGKHYALQRYEPSTGSFDNWQIHDKNQPSELLGALRFRSGRLTLARKEWTPVEKNYSGTDTMEIIYKLASEFVDKGNVNCTIRTFASLQQPGPGSLEFRETEITCGHRQIELILSWQSGPAWVQVSESVADEPELHR